MSIRRTEVTKPWHTPSKRTALTNEQCYRLWLRLTSSPAFQHSAAAGMP